MRICFTADWHFAATGGRIDTESHLNSRLIDRYRCARFVIEDAVRREADLILHCGDVFDGCKPTPTERDLAIQAFLPALNAGIPVIVLLGNHDANKNPFEKHALDTIKDTQGLKVIDRPSMLYFGKSSEIFTTATPSFPPKLMIACLPSPNKQLLLQEEENSKLTPAEVEQLLREKMMDCARGLAAQKIAGVPCLFAGHFPVDMAEAGKQSRLMAIGGNWTVNFHDLLGLGFDAILLGDIHKPQVLDTKCGDALPHAAYCGSPEAIDAGEEGEEKHYCLIEIDEHEYSWQDIPTPYRHFLSGDDSFYLTNMSAVKGAIVRLQLPESKANLVREITEQLEAAGAHEVRIEIVRSETTRRRETGVEAAMSKEEALRIYLHQRPDIAALEEAVIAEHRALAGELEGGAV